MASSSDKISMSANGGIPVVATVQAARASGVTNISVDTQQYWPTGTGIKFSTFKLNTNNQVVPGSQADWKGVSNGTNQLSNIVLVGGQTTDPGNAIGDKVRMSPTAQWGEDFVEAFLAQHSNPSGAHSNVTATSVVTSGAVTAGGLITGTNGLNVSGGTTSLPNNAITAPMLDVGAITLGYAQITTNFNVTSATPTPVTGLSVSVTIPAGSRRIRVSAYSSSVGSSGATIMAIWDGPVGTGTQLTQWTGIAGQSPGSYPVAINTPAAGAKTYNISVAAPTGNIVVAAGANYPAFILVEAI